MRRNSFNKGQESRQESRTVKNSLLTLLFKQITLNLEESVCTPGSICPPNLSSINVISYKGKTVHRQTDTQTETN